MTAARFAYVTEDAMDTRGIRSGIELAWYHAWNINGLVSRKAVLDRRLRNLFDEGLVPISWVYMYGSSNSAASEAMVDLARGKRVRRETLMMTINWLARDIDNIMSKIESILS